MGVVLINACYKQQRVVQKVEAQHLWYDGEAGWLISVTGGKLDFMYDTQTGKTRMAVVDSTKTSYKAANNYADIMNWYKVNKDEFNLEVLEAGAGTVSFSFPDAMKPEIEDALYFNRFDFEIM